MGKQYHPDANPGKDTTEQFQLVSRAYEVLKDPFLKKKYDKHGEAGIGTSAASDQRKESPVGNYGGNYGGTSQENVDLGNDFNSYSYGSGPGGAPGGVGGGGGGGGSSSGGVGSGVGGGRGAEVYSNPVGGGYNLCQDLHIDFNTALNGGEKTIRIRHLETCSDCAGDGIQPGSKVYTCDECQGTGVIMQQATTRTSWGNFDTKQTCVSCSGTGKLIEEYCYTCCGQGLMSTTKDIKVTIPPGIGNGRKLHVQGEGDAGPNGATPGDLYVFLKVKKDSIPRP